MASRGGYDGGLTAGGKIRRRPASRAAAASPYAPPAAATVPAAHSAEGSGWITRLITGSASRLISSVFRKPPPPPLPEPFNAQPTWPESLDARPSQPELLDAAHSPPPPPPPPLEDDIPEGEENGGQTAKNLYTDNPGNSVKDRDVMLRSSDCHRGIELEELLKQTTSTRSEFEYLAGLLRSRTVGYNTSQAEVGNIKQTDSGKKENGSRGLPVDFSIRSYSVADEVASPAELAKAYMGSRCPEGSPLRLRLHDLSFLPNKPVEAITVDKSLNPTLLQSSRLSASTSFDHLGSNYMTPNKSAIHKMSSSSYFKGPVPSRDMSGTVSSSYQTSNSVHTFGRQKCHVKKDIKKFLDGQ
ncbi:nuclear pore complex protein NUP1-like [Lolium rigidum]|uniref:nuclear pore complex protein NUP1-like n=1 Tax=Lolium rigidum TaxID=89674 RepID=UPI001F5D1709|nr:nuclear pore complex protein NUP1-like [Lolium rigidum]